jgi:hypothetical protein
MRTAIVAEEIANYVIYQFKNRVIQIREIPVFEQENIRDIIKDSALHILNEYVGPKKEA